MTSSDTLDHQSPPAATDGRLLRRNRSNRVAAGVCSGLGDYFGLDPVLFRVLFATAAFFGGAGILAYLLAWAAIPEAGTEHAPVDGLIAWVRRRRVPLWLAAVVVGLLLWAVAFSWWAPGPFFPVIAVVVLLVVIFTRREMRSDRATDTETSVDLTKAPPAEPGAQPGWAREARGWFEEAREASRRRRRRSLPVRLTMLVTLVIALTALGLIDAFSGIEFQVYFWTALAILGTGMLVGLVARRTPLAMTPLLLVSVAGAVAFGGSHASLHDGVGQREWKPTGVPASEYRLMFGQGILDLRSMPAQTVPRTIDVTMGAGQVRIIAKRSLNLTVVANIHIGQLEVDGAEDAATRNGGIGLTRTVSAPAGATGVPITVDVHLADGNVTVEHR